MSRALSTDPVELAAARKELTLAAAARGEMGPFGTLGFKTVGLSWHDEKGRLKFDVDGRPGDGVEHRIEGDVDPVGNGVSVGTIELVSRAHDPYGGLDFMGNHKNQVPEHVVRQAWADAVKSGGNRWARFANLTAVDQPDTLLRTAVRQNDLIYAVTLLAEDVIKFRMSAANPLKYVCHQHVSSPDGNRVMIYGRDVLLTWQQEEVTYQASDQPDEAFLALLGISNGAFVQHLIEQTGNRLGISRLVSISVRRGGYDVYWNFA